MKTRRFAVLLLANFVCLVNAHGWTVVKLHPAGMLVSAARCGNGNSQVGIARTLDFHAGFWNSNSASWVDLHPSAATESEGFAIHGSQQGGYALIGGFRKASLWTSSASSWVNLNPSPAVESMVLGMDATQQVGSANIGSQNRASIWTGSAGSWSNLHPAAAIRSSLYGTSGGQQIGFATLNGNDRAILWNGNATSWIDLHPTGALWSYGYGIDNGKQVGLVRFGNENHASLWNGSAFSLVDLHPNGATHSVARAIWGNLQVGEAEFGVGPSRPILWNNSSAGWVDLSVFLPAGYKEAIVTGISSDGINYYITGYATNIQTVRQEALIWTSPVPEPTTGFILAVTIFSLARNLKKKSQTN